jgi:uncharacterized membrane protein YeaQ/YmgE (transglycosylase-associated protein family)
MSVIAWIVLGLTMGVAIGWLAGARRRALVASVVVGVLGAIIGGFMAAVLLGLDISGVENTTLVVAAVGALLLILFERAIPATQVYE